ncbi:hypothetical protein GQ600_7039 [Phytophthora cactorum]|nr:hypothetical protein GQ600_7039 [Phytophthora cactorum]
MSTASAVPVSGAASAVSATQTESKPAATQSTDSASTTTSEYEFSSDEDDDDLEVVEVAPPKRNKKRKAATVDLSESSPVRRKTHTNSVHKELSGFVRGMFAPSDKFYNWQPRDDPMVAQLLDEMDKRMDGFKDSITQNSRRKAMDEWLQEMTASSFVPCLDLESIPPKTDLRAASVEKCHDSQDLEALVKPGTRICSKLQVDTASKKGKKRKYFQPLLDASTNITRKECAQLEELLYLVRLVMPKSQKFREKAVNVSASVRPKFNYPASEPAPKKKKRKKKKKSSS